MTRLPALSVLLALGCAGTAADDATPPPSVSAAPVAEPTPAPLQVWAHSSELEQPARDAARRILAATGLQVEVNAPGTSDTAVPLFWSEQHGNWIGMCGPRAGWLAIDRDLETRPTDLPTVVLHEILHALGAEHTADGVVAVMAPKVQGAGDGRLTAADLASVCSDATCTAFVPEAP